MQTIFQFFRTLFSILTRLFLRGAGVHKKVPQSSAPLPEPMREEHIDSAVDIDVDRIEIEKSMEELPEEMPYEEEMSTLPLPEETRGSEFPFPPVQESRPRSKGKNKKAESTNSSKPRGIKLPAESAAPDTEEDDTLSPVNTTPAAEGDVVNMTAYSPEQVSRGSSFLFTVFAHLYEQRAEVEIMAKEMDETNRRQGGKTLNTKIAKGSRLSFRLTIENWDLMDSVQELTWFGQPASLEFEVDVPTDYDKSKAIGTLVVSNENGPLGRMRFNIRITGQETETDQDSDFAKTETQSYTQAYLSYASDDQEFVDAYVEQLKQNGIDSFFNVRDKEDAWEDEVILALRKSELFLLFWSEAAYNSDEVTVEWENALGIRYGGEERLPDLVPIPLGETWPEPPYDLAFLNFSSRSTQATHAITLAPTDTLPALKAKCEELISAGKSEVFELMRTFYQSDEEVCNELYALENSWTTAKRKERLGLWSADEIDRKRRAVTFRILGMIGEMT